MSTSIATALTTVAHGGDVDEVAYSDGSGDDSRSELVVYVCGSDVVTGIGASNARPE